MRQGVGMLLTELMRIKAEGDYDAIKGLVDEYAVHFEPKLRDQVVARHKKLNVPTYWAGINSKLTARAAAEGHVQDVKISYPSDAVEQYLAYGSLYRSEEHTSELQSRLHLVCRLLLEKKKKKD